MKITLITGSEAYEKVCNVVAGRAEVLLAGVDIASLKSRKQTSSCCRAMPAATSPVSKKEKRKYVSAPATTPICRG